MARDAREAMLRARRASVGAPALASASTCEAGWGGGNAWRVGLPLSSRDPLSQRQATPPPLATPRQATRHEPSLQAAHPEAQPLPRPASPKKSQPRFGQS